MPPDIVSDDTSGDVSVQELENATLTCKATGHPPPKITWRREDHEPILLKKPFSKDFDKGAYKSGFSRPVLVNGPRHPRPIQIGSAQRGKWPMKSRAVGSRLYTAMFLVNSHKSLRFHSYVKHNSVPGDLFPEC